MKKIKKTAKKTFDFGMPKTDQPEHLHHFIVRIPEGRSGDIEIIQHYGVGVLDEQGNQAVRCYLSRTAWFAIRDAAKCTLNARLTSRDLKPSTWKTGDNKLDRILGYEMCLLAWAIEGASPEDYDTICQAWSYLRPEERWWLYRMAGSTSCKPGKSDRGWRKAITIGLKGAPAEQPYC